LAEKPKYYWDACAWIALIQQEAGRFDALSYAIEEAKSGKVEIWTSNFTLAEVYKRPCDGQQKGLGVADDISFEDYIIQDFVERVQGDFDIGTLARRLLRQYPVIVKPQDGIHLATALLNNVDQLHTYDRENLLGLSGQIDRKDGKKLIICPAPERPAPAQIKKTPLEEHIDQAKAADNENKASGSQGQPRKQKKQRCPISRLHRKGPSDWRRRRFFACRGIDGPLGEVSPRTEANNQIVRKIRWCSVGSKNVTNR
jgi:hypothetical protein